MDGRDVLTEGAKCSSEKRKSRPEGGVQWFLKEANWRTKNVDCRKIAIARREELVRVRFPNNSDLAIRVFQTAPNQGFNFKTERWGSEIIKITVEWIVVER
jgi:hypothetical protein